MAFLRVPGGHVRAKFSRRHYGHKLISNERTPPGHQDGAILQRNIVNLTGAANVSNAFYVDAGFATGSGQHLWWNEENGDATSMAHLGGRAPVVLGSVVTSSARRRHTGCTGVSVPGGSIRPAM
ncbi:MAG TPA: hypothetical protein VKU01_22695 [Bryobacteraceae bacterium]|nr:hypothetical protein [Bryobacteraceae bacterium]